MNNELDECETQNIPIFNLEVPLNINNVPPEILNPRSTWDSSENWNKTAKELAQLFKNNFDKFCDNEHGKQLLKSGPQL